jgi:methanogenic corrinoid protein MtbC1
MAGNGNHPILDELADASRRAILEQLRTGPKSVMELVEATALKQPNVSNHLAKMRERGLVVAQRSGRQVFYSLANPLVEAVLTTALSGWGQNDATADADHRLKQWSERYAAAIAAGDEEEARRIVSECLIQRLPMEDLYIEVFQHSLVQIGLWYEEGKLTEAQEHLASGITERLMAKASQFYPSMLSQGKTVILGAVAGNWHSIGLRMISDVLQHHGWHALYLGANVPTESFVQMVREKQPHMVIISCAVEEVAEEARRLVERLKALRNEPDMRQFIIGLGGGFINRNPDFVREVGADFTARDARELLALLEN